MDTFPHLLTACCVMLVSPAWSTAEQPRPSTFGLGDPMTPAALVGAVLEHNAGLGAHSAAADAARYRIEVARALDDPTLSYGFAPRTFGREGRGLNQRIELGQSIPWPGTLGARESVARRQTLAAEQDVQAMRLEFEFLARAAYAEWYFVDRTLEIHQSRHDLLVELRAIAESRYAAGLALQQDALQSEVELARLQRHGFELNRLQQSARAHINSLLNQHPNTRLPNAVDIAFSTRVPPLADLEYHALEHHPEMKRLEEQLAAESANVILAEKAFLPDLRVTASYNSLWDEADKRAMVGLAINVPLDRRKRKAALSGARADRHRAELRLADRRVRLLADVVRARAEVTESVQTVELFEQSLLPLAAEYLDATVADYRSGAGGFLAVIDAEQRKFVIEESLVRHRADYSTRVAALERWAGISLESVPHTATEVQRDSD